MTRLRLLSSVAGAAMVLAATPALAQQTFTVPPNTSQTDNDQVTGGPVTVTGGGTLIFNNPNNTYTGGTTMNANSTLQVQSDGSLGAVSGGIFFGDATNRGILSINNAPSFTSARGILLNTGNGEIDVSAGSTATFSGPITGIGSLTIGGVGSTGGTVVLTNINSTYSGGTIVKGNSTLSFDSDAELGLSAAVEGTLTIQQQEGLVTPTVQVSGITLGDATSSGTLLVNSNAPGILEPRNIVLNPGGGILSAPFSTTDTPATATTAETITNNVATFSGVISDGPAGGGPLGITGGGIISLASGANQYTGVTSVTGGTTLQIDSDAELGWSSLNGVPQQPVFNVPTLGTYAGLNLGDTTTKGILSLTNGGAISSSRIVTLNQGGGEIDTSGAPWTFTSGITGPGALTVGGSGTLVLDGQNNYQGGTTVTGGTLELGDATVTTASIANNVAVNGGGTFSGHGLINGELDNNGGTVSTGAGLISPLHVTGNYNQAPGSALSVEIAPQAAAQLNVNGTANLAGTLNLNFDNGRYAPTTYTLLTGSNVAGTFSAVNGTLSAVLNQTVTYRPGEVDLTLTQVTKLPETPTVYTALTSAAIDEAQEVNSTIMSRLNDIHLGATADQMRMATTDSHKDGTAPTNTPYGGWFRAVGGFGAVNGTGTASGFGTSQGGFVTGVDASVARGLAVGVALAYTHTNIAEHLGASGTIAVPHMSAYADWWFGNFAIDGTLGYGLANINASRPVAQVNATAVSGHTGQEGTAAVQGSGTFRLGPVVFTPAIGAQYVFLSQDSWTEAGAGAYNLNSVGGTTTNSLRPYVSATATARFEIGEHTALEPELGVTYSHEMMNNSRFINVQDTGSAVNFGFDGVSPGRSTVALNAGLTVETSRRLAFYVAATSQRSGNENQQMVDLGLRYRF